MRIFDPERSNDETHCIFCGVMCRKLAHRRLQSGVMGHGYLCAGCARWYESSGGDGSV